MVARIITGKKLRGVLNYNENKVLEGKAELILASGFAGDIDRMNFSQKLQRFENLLMLNPKVKTNTLHISLNFDSSEKLKDETLQQIAVTYMEKIGFGDQPFLAYRHNDAGHDHIHLVTTNIQATGERIDLHNIGAIHSEKARKEIEIEYSLVKAESKQYKPEPGIKAIDITKIKYGRLPTKRVISNTVNAVINAYKFTSLAELNAVLRQFNVTADRGAEDTLMFRKKGLMYSLLDEKGNKIGIPIKSSSLYTKPTLPSLEKQFVKHEQGRLQFKRGLKETIDKAIKPKGTKDEFLQALKAQGIAAIFRIGANGQAFGITYVDHKNKTVFNGSDLGKAYSAKAILDAIGQSKTSQKASDHLQKLMKTTRMSTESVEKTETNPIKTDTPEINSKLLETLMKDHFDPSGQPPKKKKRKKLRI
ncbi:relaxase/mobilization nuclease domain-containing protein [Pedobacter nyackensis]|uniref:Relaxase/Mobilisation nuclease domain-containing protein n=1 Tax=Pedobacter nyackensis TaxID=475255 RepID=A0A1W2A2D9_9SPHI|nr:relaxase/mobilization nuclease domain-containing protein [Pedobacter nyackensis]SMC54824.1 Relaxase/Mobilisation nuclease domain-containing protein [Pedobacter nyackensis]